MPNGTVKWFDYHKGYGFIVPDDKKEEDRDVFVHITALHRAAIDHLDEGQRVEYATYDDRGRTAADIVAIIPFSAHIKR